MLTAAINFHGFIAAAIIKFDGNSNDSFERLTVTMESSSGCLNTSRTFFLNSGNSSRNNAP